MGDKKVMDWFSTYAPGLVRSDAPPGRFFCSGPVTETPTGIQYPLSLWKRGERAEEAFPVPFYQGSPRFTLAITDGERIALPAMDPAKETLITLPSCFLFEHLHVPLASLTNLTNYAREAVEIWTLLGSELALTARVSERKLCLANHLHELLFQAILIPGIMLDLSDKDIVFIDRLVGDAFIRHCWLLGKIELTPKEFDTRMHHCRVLTREQAIEVCHRRMFADDGAHRLISRLFHC